MRGVRNNLTAIFGVLVRVLFNRFRSLLQVDFGGDSWRIKLGIYVVVFGIAWK
jgi:hypothetical protein